VRTVKAVTALPARLYCCTRANAELTRCRRAACARARLHVADGRTIASPSNRYFYTNSDNRPHNFAVPSNTVEITDGFSNDCSWFYAAAGNVALPDSLFFLHFFSTVPFRRMIICFTVSVTKRSYVFVKRSE